MTWLLQFGTNFTALRGHEGSVFSLAFSSDGITLASGSQGTIRLWNLQNLEANPIILGEAMSPPQSPPQTSSFNQDEATRISGENIEQTGRAAQPPPREAIPEEQRPPIQALAFSPDGKTLASGNQGGTIMIWTRTEALIEEVCRQVWRNLTLDEWHQFVGTGVPYERTCPDLTKGK